MKRSPKTPKESHTKFRLLGKSSTGYPDQPDASIIETFPNRYPNREYLVELDCSDFTSLCPVTSQPDYARISIEYVPRECCIETKSLKFYLASYRNVRTFNEEVVNRILDDLKEACDPIQIKVTGKFAARGGISVTAIADFEMDSLLF
jgi:7-cyano-7-deazaguanine reductase